MSNKETKAVGVLRAGGAMMSIIPQNVEEAYRLAKMAFRSGILKRQKVKIISDAGTPSYVDEDDDAVISRGTMAVLQGLEIGMPPMQALQLIALVGSRLVVHSEGVPAILWAKGFKLREWQEDEYTDRWTAYCELTRPDGETKITRSFSVKQAIKAKLWSPAEKLTKKGRGGSVYEADNDSAWHRFDFRMLMHRARGYAANDGGSDAMRGIGVRELVEDARTIDVTPNTPAALAIPDDIEEETTVAATVSEAEDNQDPLLSNPQQHVEELEAQLRMAATEKQFDEFWAAHESLVEAGRLPRAYVEEAEAIKAKLGKRFA